VALNTSALIEELHSLGLPAECPAEVEPMRLDSDGTYHLREVCILADIDDTVTDVDVELHETQGKLCRSCAEHLVWQHSPTLLAGERLRSAGSLAHATDLPGSALELRGELERCERAMAQLRDSSDSQLPELITMRESIRPALADRIGEIEAAITAPVARDEVFGLCADSLANSTAKATAKAAKRAAAKKPTKPAKVSSLPEAQSDQVIFGIHGYKSAAKPLDPWADDEDSTTTKVLREDALVHAALAAFRQAGTNANALVLTAPGPVYNWLRQFADNPKRPWASLTAPQPLLDTDSATSLAEVTLSLWDPDGSGLEDFAAAVEAGRACLRAPNA
jgi:hypothetical protein